MIVIMTMIIIMYSSPFARCMSNARWNFCRDDAEMTRLRKCKRYKINTHEWLIKC